MAAESWPRVAAAFEEIAALPTEERTRGLDRLCGDDRELRREVEALLAADRAAGDFLEGPAVSASQPSSWTGRRLGAYRLERKLGEGGMAVVYLASRVDQEYERRVAIKIFGHGAEHGELLQRFRVERQILASLDHPGIAGLLDGGTTEDGLPYLVMEYVDGLPIDRYCKERQLTIEARIDLFLKVCDAVAYAHRNLVVHRDLKPSNILVTADGAPRLLDFGIAKLLEGAAVAPPQATLTAQRLMTPPFASPEQIAGRAITTASDVYTLGVVLYLLLTGELPYRYDPQRLGALEQAVVEQEPTRPSSLVGEPRHSRKLAGDLDNILLKALAKEPQRRYGSVEALAEDLRRFRTGLPVAARPAGTGYRLRKFVGRHRLGVAIGAVLALLIVALALVMTLQAVRLARQRDEIRRERDKAVAVTQFLKDMFQLSGPTQGRGETVTAREILDASAAKIQAGLAGQPETQAALMKTMGEVYHGLGLDARALPLLEKSLALRRQRLGARHPEVAESLEALGQLHLERGEAAEAEAAYGRALKIRRATLPATDVAIANALNGYGMALMVKGRLDAAEPLLRQALAIDRANFSNQPREETAATLGNLAFIRDSAGDLANAEVLYRQALVLLRQVHHEGYPLTVNLLNNLGVLLTRRGEFDAAEQAYRESLDMARRAYGREHVEVAMRLHNLAFFFMERGDPARAEPLGRQALAMLRRLLGNENQKVAICLNNLGRAAEERGDLRAARQAYEEAVRIYRAISGDKQGDKHPLLARSLGHLARVLGDQGDLQSAAKLAREALAIQRETIGPAHPDLGSTLVVLGSLRLAQGAQEEAEALLRQGYGVLKTALSTTHWRTADAASRLGECLAARGQRAEAEPLLVAGSEVLARRYGAAARTTTAARERLAAFYRARGK